MARLSFRDRFFTPPVARAILSPRGIVLAGVGAAGAILLGAAVPVAGAAAVAMWGGNVIASVPRGKPRQRVDPFQLADPWRRYVVDAQVAKKRFDKVVRDMPGGPLRDRLDDVGDRLEDGIQESWRIAKRGNDLAAAVDRLDLDRAGRELAELDAAGTGDEVDTSVRSALEAQLAAGERLTTTATDAQNRLRVLDARFGELVARAVEVSVGSADSDLLGEDVDDLVVELEALRVALEETTDAEAGRDDSPVEQLPRTWPPQPDR